MATKNTDSSQIILMQRLKEMLPPSVSLVNALGDLLGLSTDSAYRRIRGETALSIEEIASICKHFKVSFDDFINLNKEGTSLNFVYKQLSSDGTAFKTYLYNINEDLKKFKKFEHKQIIFAAEDIPVFHHFFHPVLAAFKFFYWNKSILNATGFEDKKFDLNEIDEEISSLAAEVLENYNAISSVEIWSEDTANSTIKQIEFYWESGMFKSKEDAITICKLLSELLDRIKQQAEKNHKFSLQSKGPKLSANYALYHSDVMIGNNCILVDAGSVKATYLSYHTFNVMYTTNSGFCNETETWLSNLIRKSNLISGVAEKQRYRYFKNIEDQVKKLVEKIKLD